METNAKHASTIATQATTTLSLSDEATPIQDHQQRGQRW